MVGIKWIVLKSKWAINGQFQPFPVQVNLCQALLFLHQLTHNMMTDYSLNYKLKYMKIPSSEHVKNMLCTWNCSECQNKTKTTICVHNMFCRYSELRIFMKNEQPVIILWVSWCKNKSFWQRFTCKADIFFCYDEWAM